MTELIADLAILTTVVWGATEGIGRIVVWPKTQVAVVLGPLSGIVAYGAGLLSFGVEQGPWGWIASGFFGLVSTLGAAVAHDKLVTPFIPKD